MRGIAGTLKLDHFLTSPAEAPSLVCSMWVKNFPFKVITTRSSPCEPLTFSSNGRRHISRSRGGEGVPIMTTAVPTYVPIEAYSTTCRATTVCEYRNYHEAACPNTIDGIQTHQRRGGTNATVLFCISHILYLIINSRNAGTDCDAENVCNFVWIRLGHNSYVQDFQQQLGALS